MTVERDSQAGVDSGIRLAPLRWREDAAARSLVASQIFAWGTFAVLLVGGLGGGSGLESSSKIVALYLLAGSGEKVPEKVPADSRGGTIARHVGAERTIERPPEGPIHEEPWSIDSLRIGWHLGGQSELRGACRSLPPPATIPVRFRSDG